MSTLPLCCFVHLILSSLIYEQRRKGTGKRGGKRGLYWMSLEVRQFYWKLSSAQPRSKMSSSSSGVPPACAIEVGRSRGSSSSPQNLCPKQSPPFSFDNLDFPWWCPWLQSSGLHTPSLQLIFSPRNYRAGAMDLPLKRPINICFVGGGKDCHCWFSQEVLEAVRTGQ